MERRKTMAWWERAVLLYRVSWGWAYSFWAGANVGALCAVGRGEEGWKRWRQRWARRTLEMVGVQIRVTGEEHLEGPAVFVSNHQSLVDVIFLPAILPQKAKFVAKRELIRIPLWGWAFASSGAILIDRSRSASAVESIRRGVSQLPEGWSVVVFPEGTRSPDGELKSFKKGAFHIAMQAGLPIVPIGMEGAHHVMRKRSPFLYPGRIHVTVGAPIPTERWQLETLDEHVAGVRDKVAWCVERSRERSAGFEPPGGVAKRHPVLVVEHDVGEGGAVALRPRTGHRFAG